MEYEMFDCEVWTVMKWQPPYSQAPPLPGENVISSWTECVKQAQPVSPERHKYVAYVGHIYDFNHWLYNFMLLN